MRSPRYLMRFEELPSVGTAQRPYTSFKLLDAVPESGHSLEIVALAIKDLSRSLD